MMFSTIPFSRFRRRAKTVWLELMNRWREQRDFPHFPQTPPAKCNCYGSREVCNAKLQF